MDLNKNTPIMQPEEVSPEIESPEEIAGSIPPEYPTDIPVYEESSSKKIFIIVIIIFFLISLGAIYFLFFRNFGKEDPVEVPKIQQKDDVTLTYWGLWENPEVLQEIFDDYQKQNKHVTIKYEKMDPETYLTRLLARSKASNGPDIFQFHNTWLSQVQEIISAAPQEIMTSDEFDKTFYPIHSKDLKIETNIYGIPLSVDGDVLIYNEDLLKQAGVVPPTVWVGSDNDVLSIANKITVVDGEGKILTSGIALGTAANTSHFSEAFSILLLLNGGDINNLTTSEARESLQLYRRFAEDNYWSSSMPNSISAFIQGKTAMIIAPSWQILNIKAQNPELNVKAVAVPSGLDSSSVSISSYWAYGVNKFNPNQAEAWKLLKYLSEKEQLIKAYELQSKVRLFGNPYPRQDMAELLINNQYIGAVVSQAKDDVFVTLPVAAMTHDDGLNDGVIQYLENAITATQEGVDYGAALETAQKGVSDILNKYKIDEPSGESAPSEVPPAEN